MDNKRFNSYKKYIVKLWLYLCKYKHCVTYNLSESYIKWLLKIFAGHDKHFWKKAVAFTSLLS